MKPYYQVPIAECHEPLVAIPSDCFALVVPHPYQKLGAPYQDKSPFYLRQRVLEQLIEAQQQLQQQTPGWRIQVFDAYRPIAVQQFMVNYAFQEVVQQQGLTPDELTEEQRQAILEQVYEFWAAPSPNPATPPPHSTGGAIDVTLVDQQGQIVEMGSPIDEISSRSYPNHFANSSDVAEQGYHRNRELLRSVMLKAGFQQHPNEWWHFCYGDQMWAWIMNQANPVNPTVARYGAAVN